MVYLFVVAAGALAQRLIAPGRRLKMMTLGNMRQNGVRTLAITCGAVWCNHYAVLDVNAFVDDLAVPSFGLATDQAAPFWQTAHDQATAHLA